MFNLGQEFGSELGKISPDNFLHHAYKNQLRLANYLPNASFPKVDVQILGDVKADHIYQIIAPRIATIQREFAEQTGEADPQNGPADLELDGFYFEPWTEGMLSYCEVFLVIYGQCSQRRRAWILLTKQQFPYSLMLMM